MGTTCRRCRRTAEGAARGRPELAPGNDEVDLAELEVGLGATEVRRQPLAHGLLDDARAGERHQRVGLGDDDVAERRERGHHAARRRVREHRDERQARRLHRVDAADRLGHLHQREHVLLHARATGGRDGDERHVEADGQIAGAGELLADDGAHRAAHEGEVHHREHDRPPMVRGADDHRVVEPGRGLGLAQAVDVRAQIDERQRVGGAQVLGRLVEAVRVGQLLDPLDRADRKVVPAGGADAQHGAQLVVAIVRLARPGRCWGGALRGSAVSTPRSARSTSTSISSGSSCVATGAAPPGPHAEARPMRMLDDPRFRHPPPPR